MEGSDVEKNKLTGHYESKNEEEKTTKNP